MSDLMIGCVFDIYFSGQNNSAETLLSAIVEDTRYKKIHKPQVLPSIFEGVQNPSYELFSKDECKQDYRIILGNGLLGMAVAKNYNWEEFYSQLEELYKVFFKANIYESIDRMALRYTLFFKDDLFEKTETLNPKHYDKEEHYYLTSEKKIDNSFGCIKNMTNYGEYDGKFGSLYDLILFHGKISFKNENEFFSLIQKVYECSKKEQEQLGIIIDETKHL